MPKKKIEIVEYEEDLLTEEREDGDEDFSLT